MYSMYNVYTSSCSCLDTGKGGTSIWNQKFEDEFHENLKVSDQIHQL